MRLAKFCAWAAAAAVVLAATAAVPEPLPPPPLRPGEVVMVMANGCAIVVDVRKITPQQLAKSRESTRRSTWRGVCRNGLAHGTGQVDYPAQGTAAAFSYEMEYVYGRFPRIRNDGYGKTWYFTDDGRAAAASNASDPDQPVWRPWTETTVGHPGTEVVAESRLVQTQMSCGFDNSCEYKIYSVNLGENQPPGTYTPCPNLNSYVGCDVLWRQLSGSMIATYRSVRAEVERRAPVWRAELAQMNAARDARFAALDTASGQAFARSQAAAEAEGGQADRAFKAKLGTANAGQLYAMADEFERARDFDKAAQAFRALLSRFPDHALAVAAAQHLSALPPPTPAASNCTAAADEQRLAMELRAAMGRSPSGVAQYQTVMAGIEKMAAAWSRCPTDPSSAPKLRAYRAAYVQAAQRCAMISPTGACAAKMH